MEITGQIAVVTGAASGIGRALALRLARAGAKHVICADINKVGADETASACGGIAYRLDVSKEADIAALIAHIETTVGPIGLFCSNAGIMVKGGAEAPNAEWQKIWEINVMSHVWAARHMLPRMIARKGGYILNTASAAGLLSQIGAAPYSVSKHAAVGFAEWLALTHGDDGIGVSVLCPQAVRSEMTRGKETSVAALDGLLEPDAVADACIDAIKQERFLVLPHPEVLGYFQNKAADYARWIGGMRKLNRKFRKT